MAGLSNLKMQNGNNRQQETGPSPDVFIGKVPAGTRQDQLQPEFDLYGVTSFRMGNGCAFATFSSWSGAEQAIEKCASLQVGGSTLNVQWANVKGSGCEPEPKVFIGGLASSATEEGVRRLCEGFGQLVHVKIHPNRNTPVGFAQFKTFAEAEKCIQALNGQTHDLCGEGKTLNTFIAKPGNGKKRDVAKPMGQAGKVDAAATLTALFGSQANAQAVANLLMQLNLNGAGGLKLNNMNQNMQHRNKTEVPPPGAKIDPKFAHLGNRQVTGTIKSWKAEWGFIISSSFSGDLFAHKKSICDPMVQSLAPGTSVTFQVGLDSLGRTIALNISPCGVGQRSGQY